MKIWKQKSWRHELTGFEGNAELFGVNIFDYDWEDTEEKVNVFDPLLLANTNFAILQM